MPRIIFKGMKIADLPEMGFSVQISGFVSCCQVKDNKNFVSHSNSMVKGVMRKSFECGIFLVARCQASGDGPA